MTHDAFQDQVIKDLAELRSQMKSLVGNGQPGRIALLEKQTATNTRLITLIIGGLMLAGALMKLL